MAQIWAMSRVLSQFVTTHWLPTHAPPSPPSPSHATHSLGYHIGTTQVTLVRATISALLPTLKVQHTTNHHCHSSLHTHTPAAIQTVSRATESVPKILQKAWCWLAVNGLGWTLPLLDVFTGDNCYLSQHGYYERSILCWLPGMQQNSSDGHRPVQSISPRLDYLRQMWGN